MFWERLRTGPRKEHRLHCQAAGTRTSPPVKMGMRQGALKACCQNLHMWAQYLAQTSLSTNGLCSVIIILISIIIIINGKVATSQ